MSSDKGFIEVSLHIDDVYLNIQNKGEEEVFKCSLSENELDWCISTLQAVRRIQKEKKNLGTVTFKCDELYD